MSKLTISALVTVGLASLALAAGCKNNKPLAHEKASLEAEWLPFWDGKDCGGFHSKFDAWKKDNAARIEGVESRWNALPQDERNSLTKGNAEFAPVYKAQIAITIHCGMAPRLTEKKVAER
jgi:hypothetical protein